MIQFVFVSLLLSLLRNLLHLFQIWRNLVKEHV